MQWTFDCYSVLTWLKYHIKVNIWLHHFWHLVLTWYKFQSCYLVSHGTVNAGLLFHWGKWAMTCPSTYWSDYNSLDSEARLSLWNCECRYLLSRFKLKYNPEALVLKIETKILLLFGPWQMFLKFKTRYFQQEFMWYT